MDQLRLKCVPDEGISKFWDSFVLPIIRYRKLASVIIASTVLLTLAYSLALKNKYTSTTVILPSGNSSKRTGLKELAAGSRADLDLGSVFQGTENSSELYPKILSSRFISEKIVKRQYTFRHDSKNMSMILQDYIGIDNIDFAIHELKDLIRIDIDRRTGVISLSATTQYPGLSAAIVHAYYNIEHRKSKALNKERFLSRRLKEVQRELRLAEDSLKAYEDENLNYLISEDPELQLELARQKREIQVKSSICLTLRQQHELAKLDVTNDIPVIQVLDSGSVPLVKSYPPRKLFVLTAFTFSLIFSVLFSLWFDLSAKRQFKKRLKKVLSSPELNLSKTEKLLVSHVARITNISTRELSSHDSRRHAQTNKSA